MGEDQGENAKVDNTGIEKAGASPANAFEGARPGTDCRSVELADFARCKEPKTRRRPPVHSELRVQ